MSDQQDILISTSVLLKGPRDEKAMRQLRDRIAVLMQGAIDNALASERVEWSRESTTFHYLESSSGDPENARRCFYCSSWATDRSRLDAIDGLMPGCELGGRWV